MSTGTTASDLSDRLARQAEQGLQGLLRQIDAQCRQADAVRERVITALGSASDAHTYAVFAVPDTRRFMVLRDVPPSDTRQPLFTTSDFAAAVFWVNQQLDTQLASPTRPAHEPNHPSPSA